MEISKVLKRNSRSNSPKGAETVGKILRAAKSVLIDVGYNDFTMRKISKKANMSLGNLSYYYNSKQLLLSDLLEAVLERYLGMFDSIMHNLQMSDADKLKQIIKTIVLDFENKETTHFFPELWALANHNKDAEAGMDLLYKRARSSFNILIPRLNPTLSKEDCDLLTLFISASLEGHTMFLGEGKSDAHHRENIAELASTTFLNMILNAKPSQR